METRDTYEVQMWEKLPAETTPINAERLSHIEQGIKDAADKRALKDIYDDDAINFGRKNLSNIGGGSIALGFNVEASGVSAFAEGSSTVASGRNSHAENSSTEASGEGSHAEGDYSEASGDYSHAENCSVAIGDYSHAEGFHTNARGNYQHVSGKFNIVDVDGAYAEIVGGGTGYSDSDRKNIRTLDWAGNAYYAGDVTNGVGVSLNSLKSAVDNLSNIAGGGSIAKVFDTKADLDTWLAAEGNAETLVVGQNIYIKATDTPDYWWDGTGLQILETDKVEIESMTYNETMSILNASAEEVE